MESEPPEGKPGATPSPTTVDCDVTSVPDSDPPTMHYDVTAVPTSDLPAVDYDVTAVPTSDLPAVDYNVTAVPTTDLPVAKNSDPPTVDYDVTVAKNPDLCPVDYAVAAAPTSDPPSADHVAMGRRRKGSAGGTPHRDVLQTVEQPGPAKLCGYLHKLGGPLKGWKSRWFVYEERNCHLFYYRTAQDAGPLGHIPLTDAIFSYPLQANEGTFHIQTPQRLFILKAVNRETMMYWLQQLQLRRWQHREAAGQSVQLCADTPEDGMTFCAANFLTIVKAPTGLVGEEAARQPAPRQQAALSNVSFKHPLTEIQNSVRSLRLNRPSQELSRSVFHCELSQETTPTDPESPAHTTPSLQSPAPKSPAHMTPSLQGLVPMRPAPQRPAPKSPAPKSPTPESSAQERQNATVPPGPLDQSATSSQPAPPECEDPGEGKVSPGPSPNLQARMDRIGTSASLPPHWSEDRKSHLQQEVRTLSEELRIQKEMVRLLHQALEEAQREKRASSHFVLEGKKEVEEEEEEEEEAAEEEAEEALRVCERDAVGLTAQLRVQRDLVGALQHALEDRDAQVAELQRHIELMVEKNRAKQEVVLRLSEQVEACLADPLRPVANTMEAATFQQLQQDIYHLQDDIAAYKTQNKFLNSEIYQLTWLWRKSSEQEKNLMMKCAYLETRNYHKDRRYLGVLRALQDNEQLDSSQQEAIESLIEEALLGDMKGRLNVDPIREYDYYGFKMVPEFDLEDVKLLAKIQAVDVHSHNVLRRAGSVGGDGPQSARWAQYLSSCPSDDLATSPELKGLLRAGVPPEYRRQVWLWLVRTRTGSLRDRHPQRYQEMLDKSRASPHPASRQIQLDLHRTLTGNQHFSSPSDPTVQKLHRVLLAFSWQNPAIGYCQGLNRLAAIALLVLQNEEEAFWCLVAVVETIMPQDYYSKTLAASQADQRVLKDLMVEKLPRLAAHLEELEVDVSLITFNWFLVVFIESLTTHMLLQIWDAFLYEGTKVLFRYALAVLKYREEDILKIRDKVEMYQYLRFFTKTIIDGRKLMSIAFSAMNPLPMKLLTSRRALQLERMRAELSELERIQSEYTAQHHQRADKDLYAIASEDDDDA